MNKIDEMIRWYEENETRREYTLIKAKLNLIKNLFVEIEDSDDRMFLDEIIDNFSAIMELHRDVIADKETELECCYAGSNNSGCAYNYTACPPQQGSLRDDKQLMTAFTTYLTTQKKKPLSSYTINDYCSRIRNLWKAFYTAHQEGFLPEKLRVNLGQSLPENPLINAYHYIEDLQYYARWMSMQSEEKRNWANTVAALNKFAEFATKYRQQQ